ncbi:peptidoglycan-binding protein [Streptomyces sp. NBC_00287]|uniref:peptidoglycan-binding domain-containing protein n=1 Tax=Streptomyces sp. NBC_00287 TaxID=2975702 RepID=UPI002E281939|nr:peptidoglycan-binding domain-containing protein [Streptomyces sp. NBC_00287]
MTDPKDHGCPECGAPRGTDSTPSCACTERASEALRDAREAQAAAAEDFDPLRIRPYVELDGTAELDPSSTMPLSTPLAPPVVEPSATDIHLFEETTPQPAQEERARGRRGKVLLLGAAGAVVAVVAAAGMASGLFSYESPTRDTALPEAVRASVPDPTPSEPKPAPESKSPTPASASPTPSPTKSETPSPSASSASPTPSGTPTPTQTSTPARASDAPPAETTPDPDPPILRRGDKGAEVTELQLRLHQLYLYNGDINGNFNEQVENALKNYQWSRGVGVDNLGVYDTETRASLESETSEP